AWGISGGGFGLRAVSGTSPRNEVFGTSSGAPRAGHLERASGPVTRCLVSLPHLSAGHLDRYPVTRCLAPLCRHVSARTSLPGTSLPGVSARSAGLLPRVSQAGAS